MYIYIYIQGLLGRDRHAAELLDLEQGVLGLRAVVVLLLQHRDRLVQGIEGLLGSVYRAVRVPCRVVSSRSLSCHAHGRSLCDCWLAPRVCVCVRRCTVLVVRGGGHVVGLLLAADVAGGLLVLALCINVVCGSSCWRRM